MIDVKEMREDNEATAKVREEVRKGWGGKAEPLFRVGGPYEGGPFRDPAEIVTISADRFEQLIRSRERVNHELEEYEMKISRVLDFIGTVAQEWAEKGSCIPRYEDITRIADILEWKEPANIRIMREKALAEKMNLKREQEAANNGEATD